MPAMRLLNALHATPLHRRWSASWCPLPNECGLRITQVPPRLLMGPGPSNSHPRVLVAQGLPTLGAFHAITLYGLICTHLTI
jgi:hypothetical protein